jgi:catechol 1,2-dioxygenase
MTMERRTFIKNSTLTVTSVSAFGALNWNGKNFEGDTPTTTDILGPFYRPGAPMRTDLTLPNTKGTPLVFKGTIFKEDGKTPIENALVEIWHCSEDEIYDNMSEDFNYRGGQKTRGNGKYQFKTIIPVPYLADAKDVKSWRPAHIHMRVSVPHQQDLITQIYFKGGKYVETDTWASDPSAINRHLTITKSNSGVSEIIFNVIMSKEVPLDEKVYSKITGLYNMNDKSVIEFLKNDDLLFLKRNGQLSEALKYIGDNTFEAGIGFPKVRFELLEKGGSKTTVTYQNTTYTGEKYLKYN